VDPVKNIFLDMDLTKNIFKPYISSKEISN